jgi:hypothetical protein
MERVGSGLAFDDHDSFYSVGEAAGTGLKGKNERLSRKNRKRIETPGSGRTIESCGYFWIAEEVKIRTLEKAQSCGPQELPARYVCATRLKGKNLAILGLTISLLRVTLLREA